MFCCCLLRFTKVLKHCFCKSISVVMKSFVVPLLWAELKCGLLVLPDPGGSPLLSFSLLVALKGSNWLGGSTQKWVWACTLCRGIIFWNFFLFLLTLFSLPFCLLYLSTEWAHSLLSHWYPKWVLALFQPNRLCCRVGLWLLTWLCQSCSHAHLKTYYSSTDWADLY